MITTGVTKPMIWYNKDLEKFIEHDFIEIWNDGDDVVLNLEKFKLATEYWDYEI